MKNVSRVIAGIAIPILFYAVVTVWITSGEQWFEGHVASRLPFDTSLTVFVLAFSAWIAGMAIAHFIFDSRAAMMNWISGILNATEEYNRVHGSVKPHALRRRHSI